MAKVNDMYFGVTDHHVIIPLRVIDIEEVGLTDDSMVQAVTEIACEATSYMERHHLNYFKYMWLNDNGLPYKGSVFANKKDAVAYALKNAEDEVKTKQKAIDGIERQISKLRKDNV